MKAVWLSLCLAACASAPEPPPGVAGDLPIPEGQARLYVYRPESSAKTPREPVSVSVDGRPLAELGRDEYASIVLPPGDHRVSPSRQAPARPVSLHEGEALYCRVVPAGDSVVLLWDLRCSGPETARGALRECSMAPLDRTVDWQR